MKLITICASTLSLAALSVFWLGSAAPVPDPTPVGIEAASSPLVPSEDVNWGTFEVDAGHSAIGFKIKHMGVSWSRGRFNDFGGEVVLDADPSKCSVSIEVEAKSVDTNSEKRDNHLRAPDFFDVVQHPLIGFESVEVASAGSGKYQVTGKLSLHGVTKEVELVMELVGTRDGGARSGYLAGFEGQLVIDRTDFGMTTYAENGALGKEVTITLSFEMKRK